MASVCVEIAVRDDPRLLDALRSLDAQTRRPERVLVAASDQSPRALLDEAVRRFPRLPIAVLRFPGGVVDARAGAQPTIAEEITAFLDSDETAPPGWLATLVAPLEHGTADFVGGPTRPSREPANAVERYSVLLERSIYDHLVAAQIAYLPLQNTAWRSALVRRLGFDPRIPFAEDHDLETRAVRAGARGVFVADAWVYHDPATGSGYFAWTRKRYRYLVAMAMSLVKNGGLSGRLRERRRWVHPLAAVEAIMRPFALAEGTIRWRRIEHSVPATPTPPTAP